MKKRLWSFFLTLVLCLTLLPTAAFAADTGKAIQLGTDALSKNVNTATAPTVYFGQNHENNPSAWRVIGYDGSGVAGAQGDMTLLAAGNMGEAAFNSVDSSGEYAPSDLKTAIDALARKLTAKENAAVKKRTLTSGGYTGENTDCVAGAQVDNAVFWPLSSKEAIAVNEDLRVVDPEHPTWATSYWWLRSPGSHDIFTAIVDGSGEVCYDGGYPTSVEYGVRPAFNLNLNSVLFTSAAVGGKPDGGLTPISEHTGNEWKLTLLDNSRNFAVTEKTVSGDTITFSYSNAQTGTNEYISVVIKDNGEITHYGRILHLGGTTGGASGTASLTLPAGITLDNDTKLYVFNEQYNGNYKTDYASDFTDIALTVENQPDEQFSLAPGGRYYFDLSAMNIPGTANGGNSDGAVSLPDTSLHYVPFTYVGTIEAYKLTSATATTEEYAQQNKYPHSLFVADYAVTHTISWGGLNDEGLIFGKNYASGGVDYTLRAPSVGSNSTGSGDSQRGVPQSNEWDTMLNKNSGYIQNWNKMYSWGQDTSSAAESFRAYRGYNSARFWYYTSSSFRNVYLGFRPVLELPTDLAADSLKIVELLTGEFMPGEQQNWINIIVKKGESFKAPSAEGLPRPDGISADAQLWWVDENSNFYKPGDTVPADVSALTALWGGFGLFLDRGDGAVEVTPDNYTDIFGDGTASFVLPKGKNFSTLRDSVDLTGKDILEIYSTGRLERYGCVFPNLKLKNADLTSVRLSEKYIGKSNPLFITADGKNTVESLNGISKSRNTLSILGNGSLTLNGALTLSEYTQYGGGSVTMTDGLTAYYLTVDSGSLTVTGDPQAITLRDQDIGYLAMGDGARLFTGSSAQDATEAVIPQLSAEMQELYQRYLAGDNTLTNEEFAALNNALREQFNAISQQLPGKAYVRITGAWDVTYQPGTNGSGNAVTDIKFYNDALTLRGALFTRTGYTQVGWATVDGGEKVYAFGGGYTTNAALTLYPVWTRSSSGGSSGSSSPSYAVTVPDKTEHGTVTANRRYAEKGDTVTITVTPDSGYVLETISVTDKNGNDLKLTDKGNGKYTFTMPTSKVEIKATFMEDNSVLNFFYDVPNDAYYYEAVKWAAENGITGGVGNSLFAPNQPCTRAQIVTFLWRAAGSPVVNYRMPFTDVDEGVYYAEAVRWAASTGIVTGLTETTFGANGVCTRAQVVTMLYRFAKVQGMDTTQGGMAIREFDDFDSVPAYALEAMDWAVNTGVFKGDNNRLLPQNACTRAQIVTLLRRAFGK